MRLRLALVVAVSIGTLDGCSCEAPAPNVHVSPGSTVQVGQTVTFDSNSQPGDPPDHVNSDAGISWDLDGDGKFELSPGPRVVQRSFDAPGTYHVTIDVLENVLNGLFDGEIPVHGYATRTITVAGTNAPPGQQPPSASFTASPNPGYTERAISFDASASSDPDGQIVKYEWDWQSDGTYDETDTAPTTTHSYPFSGANSVRLRVTDNDGHTAIAENTVQVVDGVPPSKVIASESHGVSAASAGSPFTLALGKVTFTHGTTTVAGTRLVTAGIRSHGRVHFTRAPAILGKHHSPRWAGTLALVQRGNAGQAKFSGQGFILLSFTKRDALCLAGTGTGALKTPFTGKLATAGGKGFGSRIRGTGTFTPPKRVKGKPALQGRLRLRRVHRARGLPKACRKLVRDLPR
jgi:PKD domain